MLCKCLAGWYLLVGIGLLVLICWSVSSTWYLMSKFLAGKFFHLRPLLVLDQVPLLQLVSVLVQLIWHPILQLLKEVLDDRFRIVESSLNFLILTATSFFSACDWIVAARYLNVSQKLVSPSSEHFHPKLKFYL